MTKFQFNLNVQMHRFNGSVLFSILFVMEYLQNFNSIYI